VTTTWWLAVDGSWRTCGLAGELIALCAEALLLSDWKAIPRRLTLPEAPAPTSRPLEQVYYPTVTSVVDAVKTLI